MNPFIRMVIGMKRSSPVDEEESECNPSSRKSTPFQTVDMTENKMRNEIRVRSKTIFTFMYIMSI